MEGIILQVEKVDSATFLKELVKAVRGEVKEEIAAAIPRPVEFITQQEACKLLKVSPQTFKKYVEDPRRPVHAYRVGNTLRYKKDEVLDLESI